MKTLLYILLFILPLTGLTQNDSIINSDNQTPVFNNQIELDVYIIGVEGSYKRRIKPKLFAGFGLGTTMLRTTLNSDFEIFGGYIELISLRPFLDFELNKKFHLETGLTLAVTVTDFDNFGYSVGAEIGVFLRIWKLEVGLRPSLLYFKSAGRDNFYPAVLTTTLLIIKIPLKRW